MKILFWNPDCGSGIEQIGYVYALMLKNLGHDIDLQITQCTKQQEEISKIIDQYDCIILNEPHEHLYKRMNLLNKNNIYTITHGSIENIPLNINVLSLNYFYHTNITPNYINMVLPLTYPFAFKRYNYNKNRIYKTSFIGRFNEYKFTKEFISLLQKNKMKIDAACIGKNDYSDVNIDDIIEKSFYDANINKVYEILQNSKYAVIPSITECLCLVVGEALVNGCIPVILNKYDNKTIFNQFIYGFRPESEQIMIDILLKNKDFDMTYITEWANEKFSIHRCYKELECLFGKTLNEGKLDIILNGLKIVPESLSEKREFYNASYMIEGKE